MKMLFAALTLVVAAQAEARSMYPIRTIAVCKSNTTVVKTEVMLQHDLVQNNHVITVTRKSRAGEFTTREVARMADVRRQPIGSPAIFISKNLVLQINFTVSPGNAPGSLTFKAKTEPRTEPYTVELVCQNIFPAQ